jgi:DNA repair protein RecO (recombination protein O)
MPSFVDSGIVLRRVDYSDSDRILTVLTREHGKVAVIARGVRKPKARMAAHTDLLARSTMQLATGRGEMLTLTQAQDLAQRGGPDSRRAACAAVIAELTDRVLEPGHPDPVVFDLVEGALRAAADPARDPRAGLIWFARTMIERLGYSPQLQRCSACGLVLAEEESAFSAGGGGLLCPGCARLDLGAIPCSVRVIKILRVAQAGDSATWARLRLDPATLATLELISERELEHHLDRRLRSWDVLRALGAAQG